MFHILEISRTDLLFKNAKMNMTSKVQFLMHKF